MGFSNSFLNVLFNPVGIFQEASKAVSSASGGDKVSAPSAPLPMPAAPKAEDSATQAQANIAKKRAASSQSIYTSPLGVAGEASVVRKTLLGQ